MIIKKWVNWVIEYALNIPFIFWEVVEKDVILIFINFEIIIGI